MWCALGVFTVFAICLLFAILKCGTSKRRGGFKKTKHCPCQDLAHHKIFV